MDIAVENSYPTPFANSPFLPTLLMSLALQKHTPDTTNTIRNEYDYIVVGAGSAGSVVASRLSELPCVSVLLLEAGRPPPLLTEIPGGARSFFFTDIDWQFKTTPQKYTGFGLDNNQVYFPMGKTIGGSSVLNGNFAARGNRRNYDQWAEEGAKGWSYDDVLPYFKKSEDNRDPEYVANGFHGVGGPVTVHRPRYRSEIKDPVARTAESMGYKFVDSNGPRQTGMFDLQGTLRSGQRCSAGKAYLVPAENRTNLDILARAMVRKVLIKHRRAVGVQFDFQNNTYEVRARREVIMSAGTIKTPQLLMLSGIGPRKELERFKIPQIAELPVGQNFHDQGGSFLNFLLRPDIQRPTDKLANPINIAQYLQNRTGPLGSNQFISLAAFFKNNEIHPKIDFPDHELYFFESQTEIVLQTNIKPEVYAQVYAPYEGRPFYACISSQLNPRSRGTVTLLSTDPYDPPAIDPNYLDDPQDMEDIVEGLKTCMRFGRSPLMQSVGSTPIQTVVPGCEKFLGDEDSYLRCFVRNIFVTYHHPVGTARMGDPHDPRTVVDPELRLLHVDGLRVVDGSVIPTIPSANINLPIIMIAEKASDIIKSSIECHVHPEDHWSEEPVHPEEGIYPAYYDKHGEDDWADSVRP